MIMKTLICNLQVILKSKTPHRCFLKTLIISKFDNIYILCRSNDASSPEKQSIDYNPQINKKAIYKTEEKHPESVSNKNVANNEAVR